MDGNKRKHFPKSYPPFRVFWNWELTHVCNYKCSYCPTWHDGIKVPRYLSVSEWREVWDRMFDLYYSGVVRFTGGEPSGYPYFTEIVAAIAQKHTIDITTNLSCGFRQIEMTNGMFSRSLCPRCGLVMTKEDSYLR